jgi:hypothetical protein
MLHLKLCWGTDLPAHNIDRDDMQWSEHRVEQCENRAESVKDRETVSDGA